MKPQAAMVFAAGFGTRMMPLTQDKPKPMVEVLGRPLIDIALDHVRRIGASPIIVNTHYKAEVLRRHLMGSEVVLVHESPEILDTGGGLRNALPLLGTGPVWTVNPDVIWRGPNPLKIALDRWDPDVMDALLVCVEPDRAIGTESSGDFMLSASGQVTRGPGVLYGGVQIVRTDRLSDIPDRVFSLNRLWDLLIAKERCYGVVYPGQWCDVGRPEGITMAEGLLIGDD